MQNLQLRAFHAVDEHGGFSKTALALGLTQPAVSDQVRRLEQEFGVTLFNRHARRVEGREALAEAVAHGLGIGVMARAEAESDARVASCTLRKCRAEMVEALVCLADRSPSHLLDALLSIPPAGEAMA